MCAVAVANLIWNQGKSNLEFCRFRVEYQTPKGTYRHNFYDCTIQIEDRKRMSVTIKRSGGGLACTIDLKEDSQNWVEMTHQTQHVAGLLERYRLEKKEIRDGQHRHSEKYRDFRGQIKHEDTLELVCEVKHPQTKRYVLITYVVTIDSIRINRK